MDGYRISEVADRTGFPPSTLRYYEDVGLLPEPARTEAGYRVYDEEDVDLLLFVGRAKRLGLSLEEITHLAEARRDDCGTTRGRLVELLDAKLRQVHEEVVELTRFSQQLEEVYERVSGQPPSSGRCGPDCGCSPEIGESRVEGADPAGRPMIKPPS